MLEIIIPTMRRDYLLYELVAQIRETAGMPYRIIHTGLNGSAAANRNLGLSKATGDVVVMVDDDIEFTLDCIGWLRVMSDALANPEVVMVSAQLLEPGGRVAYMTGLQDCGLKPKKVGYSIVPTKRLLTACCAFKHCGLRFDEGYIGSGFEDIDFCNQLAEARPDGIFMICHGAKATHKNEAKNQRGEFWTRNEIYYKQKWGNS